jgi:hypothetical protein
LYTEQFAYFVIALSLRYQAQDIGLGGGSNLLGCKCGLLGPRVGLRSLTGMAVGTNCWGCEASHAGLFAIHAGGPACVRVHFVSSGLGVSL